MAQFIQLLYIFTIIIGAVCFSTQTMVVLKNLDVSNEMVKSKKTTTFFAIILIFNICDFLSVFLDGYVSIQNIEWILIIENVLEVALAYALIAMEAECAGMERKPWMSVFFISMGVVILWTDTLYSADMLVVSERFYMALMIVLNMIPLAVAAYFCVVYMRSIIKEIKSKVVEAYLITYNIVFVFLCIVVTFSIIDSRTEYDFIKYDKTVYVIFWFLFNGLNAVLIWKSCKIKPESQESPPSSSIEEKIEELASSCGLSAREKEIALLIYKGKTNDEIEEILFLSTNTIKVHTSNLYKKMGVSNRVSAVQKIRGEE